jgi:RNA polymerase sigma-70 factor (ECF subfamily)
VSAVDLQRHVPSSGPDPASPAQRVEGVPMERSFQRLYEEHASMVWRGLLRLGVPETAVEDAVQDVFLVVHRREGDFQARSSVRTWIYGIVVRVAKDHRRAALRHRRRLSEVERLSTLPEPSTSPAEHAERQQAARIVGRVLARMPDAQREVLVLVELMDLSTAEAADALGCSLRTSQRLLGRARESFDALLAEETRERSHTGLPPEAAG